jgi:hypothetical protein
MDTAKSDRPWFGSLLIVSSSVAYSSAGYFTRLIDLDVPTVLFWRCYRQAPQFAMSKPCG